MRMGSMFTVAVVGIAAFPVTAHADRRAYGQTYEAVTAPKGELDVETWHTFATGGDVFNGPPDRGHRTMLELEYGFTDRWDVALYNMLDVGTQDPGYAGFKIESRYRLALPGEWFVDPVLYLEYKHLFRGDATDAAEVKGIFGKDLGPWNLAANLALEVERFTDGKLNPEFEYAFGVSREIVSPAFKVGAEVFGKLEKPEGQLEKFVWVGPAISWATSFNGAMRGLWITLAVGRGLTEESPAVYGRGIVGLQF